MTFAEKVKEKRIEKGYTQKEMADMFGVSQTYWSLIERGILKPFKLAYIICRDLNLPFDYLDEWFFLKQIITKRIKKMK